MWKFFPTNIQICIFKVKFQSKNSAIKSNLSLKFHIFFETNHYLVRIVAPVHVENFCNSVECWCVQLVNLVNTCGHLVSIRSMVKVTFARVTPPPNPPTPNRGPNLNPPHIQMWRCWDVDGIGVSGVVGPEWVNSIVRTHMQTCKLELFF